MKPSKLSSAFLAAILVASLSLHGAMAVELAPIFDSAAGRYFLRELGLGESGAISAELESRLASDLERVRARLAQERGSASDLFAPGTRALSAAEEAALRNTFIEQGQEVREFLNLGERPAGYAANRETFLHEPPLPRGKGIVFMSQRPDLLNGRIYRIEIPRDNVRLDQFVDRFEQGAIDDFLRRYPRELESVGVRIIEKLPASTVIEVPDIDALNARIRMRGYGFQFEPAPSEEALPIKPYLEDVVRGRIPVAPVGQSARMFTHDLLVHAIAITAFMPAEASRAFSEEAAALLRVYGEPGVQGSPALKNFVKSVMRSEVILFDQQTAQIMVLAGGAPETRAARLAELFRSMSGGSDRALTLLQNPDPALSQADKTTLAGLLRAGL